MSQFAAVSRERHGAKKWRRFTSFAFAAKNSLLPVVGTELGKAALSMPLAFSKQADRYTLVTLLSLTPGRNMFVGPDGRWLAGYVPACLRGYPFGLLRQPGADNLVLCVDEESGLVVEGNSAGEDFFDRDGNLSPALKQVFEFLMAVERSRRATDLAVAALAEASVIQSWQVKLKTEQGEQAISGLYHIDEAALSALPDNAFLKVRKAAALSIAYAQLLSAGRLGIFQHLAKLHAQLAPPPAVALPETVDSLFEMPANDVIRFE